MVAASLKKKANPSLKPSTTSFPKVDSFLKNPFTLGFSLPKLLKLNAEVSSRGLFSAGFSFSVGTSFLDSWAARLLSSSSNSFFVFGLSSSNPGKGFLPFFPVSAVSALSASSASLLISSNFFLAFLLFLSAVSFNLLVKFESLPSSSPGKGCFSGLSSSLSSEVSF